MWVERFGIAAIYVATTLIVLLVLAKGCELVDLWVSKER